MYRIDVGTILNYYVKQFFFLNFITQYNATGMGGRFIENNIKLCNYVTEYNRYNDCRTLHRYVGVIDRYEYRLVSNILWISNIKRV